MLDMHGQARSMSVKRSRDKETYSPDVALSIGELTILKKLNRKRVKFNSCHYCGAMFC